MAKLFVFLSLLLVAYFGAANTFKLLEPSQPEVLSTQQMDEFLKQHPNAIKMQRKVLSEGGNQRANEPEIEYTYGKRADGDTHVAHDEQTQSWSTSRDVEMPFAYPSEGGNGALLTYASVKVRQSTLNGSAYVASGGIGQRNMRIVIGARDTFIFDSVVNFYGY